MRQIMSGEGIGVYIMEYDVMMMLRCHVWHRNNSLSSCEVLGTEECKSSTCHLHLEILHSPYELTHSGKDIRAQFV